MSRRAMSIVAAVDSAFDGASVRVVEAFAGFQHYDSVVSMLRRGVLEAELEEATSMVDAADTDVCDLLVVSIREALHGE